MHSEFPTSRASQTSSSGFSLPEVAMAIGIIAIAFVALIGLLPVGLNTFRAAIDESNETWIMQSMNSMIQTTDFSQIEDLGYEKSQDIFYYDEGAKLLVGEETGETYRIGQRLTLRLAEANPVSGSLRYELPEGSYGGTAPRRDRQRPAGRRGRPPNIRHQGRPR